MTVEMRIQAQQIPLKLYGMPSAAERQLCRARSYTSNAFDALGAAKRNAK